MFYFIFFSIKGLAGWVQTLNGRFHYLFIFFETVPKGIFKESTNQNEFFGAAFSADVIKKDCQLILICR